MDLLEVFGGRDNLVLMCEARGFYEDVDQVFIRFEVGDKLVYLSPISVEGYGLLVYHLDTLATIADEHAKNGVSVRALFERYTGYSLSF